MPPSAWLHSRSQTQSFDQLVEGSGLKSSGGIRETKIVPTLTLDLLAAHFSAPDVLKIDVEGAEALVLSGASTVLDGRPVVICEVTSPNEIAVHTALRNKGYELFDADTPLPRERLGTTHAFNLLAIPIPDTPGV